MSSHFALLFGSFLFLPAAHINFEEDTEYDNLRLLFNSSRPLRAVEGFHQLKKKA